MGRGREADVASQENPPAYVSPVFDVLFPCWHKLVVALQVMQAGW